MNTRLSRRPLLGAIAALSLGLSVCLVRRRAKRLPEQTGSAGRQLPRWRPLRPAGPHHRRVPATHAEPTVRGGKQGRGERQRGRDRRGAQPGRRLHADGRHRHRLHREPAHLRQHGVQTGRSQACGDHGLVGAAAGREPGQRHQELWRFAERGPQALAELQLGRQRQPGPPGRGHAEQQHAHQDHAHSLPRQHPGRDRRAGGRGGWRHPGHAGHVAPRPERSQSPPWPSPAPSAPSSPLSCPPWPSWDSRAWKPRCCMW